MVKTFHYPRLIPQHLTGSEVLNWESSASSTLDLAATLSAHEKCCVAVSLCVQQIANNEQSNTEGHRIGSKAHKTLSTHSHNTRHKYQESDIVIFFTVLGLIRT